MSFIDKLLKNRERSRLEREAAEAASPAAFVHLAQLLQAEGDLTQARQTARRGLTSFPGDAALVRLERDLAALERDAECRRLRDEIARYPNGRLCARLAELYRSGNEHDKAMQVARSGLASYPEHDGLHHVMGLLLADKGSREEACRHLTRAVELDKFNSSALRLLSRLLGELGRHTEAAEYFARLRQLAPEEADVRGDRAHRGAAPASPAAAPAAPATPATPATPAKVKAPVPPARAAAPAAPSAPAAAAAQVPGPVHTKASMAAIAISRLTGRDGIDGAILVDAAGQVVAAALPAGLAEQDAAAATADLRRAAGPACGELGLGGFEDAAVETSGGGFYLYAIRDMSLGIVAAPRSRPALIAQHAAAFARKLHDHDGGPAGGGA
ncbi:MAG TPA: roadblock/LC7 domain-containing protein [Planctomycetota bacterium]|nr:roadblock/LC7 domain-containing protein [Planctomycetota bacterium]